MNQYGMGLPTSGIVNENSLLKESESPEVTKGKFEVVAEEIAKLVSVKNKAYGDSFKKSGNVIRELYPTGVKPEQYDDMLSIVRILDKLFRIATYKNALGEDPWKDVMGYALLSVERNKNGS